MIIYTVSEVMESWRISRYDYSTKSVTSVCHNIENKTEALARAVIKAEDDRPSKVMRISKGGKEEIIAQFETD